MSSTTKSLVKFAVTGLWTEDNYGRVLTEAEKAYATVRFEEQIGVRSSGMLVLPVSLEIHSDVESRTASLLCDGACVLEGLVPDPDRVLQFCYDGENGYLRYFRVEHTFEP